MRHPRIVSMDRLHRTWSVRIEEGQHMSERPLGMRASEWIDRSWSAEHRWLVVALASCLWAYWRKPPIHSSNPLAKGNWQDANAEIRNNR